MRTASKLLIMLCLMSKKAKGSLKYSSLEEAMHAFRTNVLGSEELLNSEELLKSEQFTYSDKSKSEESLNSDEASKSKEASNSPEEVYHDSRMTRHPKSRSRSKSVSSERAYRAGVGPSFGKEIVKATSRVRSVHMSNDGKNFSISSNFNSPSNVAKFETSQASFLRADNKPCIFEYQMKQSDILVTGCENEVREIQIQRKNSPPFYGKIYPDGKVDEIELPQFKDKILYPDFMVSNATKGKGTRSLMKQAKLPECMDLDVYLYYGPSFEQVAGGDADAKALRIVTHAKKRYMHPEFPTKINLIPTIIKLERDTEALVNVPSLIPEENFKKGRLHAFLVSGKIGFRGPEEGVAGIAWTSVVCSKQEPSSKKNAGPYSLTTVYSSSHTDMTPGDTLAHELAHNLGVGHDFESTHPPKPGKQKQRTQSCGPGLDEPGGALMNYGRPLNSTWSKCTQEDFMNYFQYSQPFCLKTSTTCSAPNTGGEGQNPENPGNGGQTPTTQNPENPGDGEQNPTTENPGNPGSCEDNTAYFQDPHSPLENNDGKATKMSSDDCQQACIDNPECQYWTWMKWTKGECYGHPPCHGSCYLKARRKNVISNSQFISGNRYCKLVKGTTRKFASFIHAIKNLAKHNFSKTKFPDFS